MAQLKGCVWEQAALPPSLSLSSCAVSKHYHVSRIPTSQIQQRDIFAKCSCFCGNRVYMTFLKFKHFFIIFRVTGDQEWLLSNAAVSLYIWVQITFGLHLLYFIYLKHYCSKTGSTVLSLSIHISMTAILLPFSGGRNASSHDSEECVDIVALDGVSTRTDHLVLGFTHCREGWMDKDR